MRGKFSSTDELRCRAIPELTGSSLGIAAKYMGYVQRQHPDQQLEGSIPASVSHHAVYLRHLAYTRQGSLILPMYPAPLIPNLDPWFDFCNDILMSGSPKPQAEIWLLNHRIAELDAEIGMSGNEGATLLHDSLISCLIDFEVAKGTDILSRMQIVFCVQADIIDGETV